MTSRRCSAIAGWLNRVTAANAGRHIHFPDNAYTTLALSSLNGSPSVGECARFALLRALEIESRIMLFMSPGRAARARILQRTISAFCLILSRDRYGNLFTMVQLTKSVGHKYIRES